MIKKQIREETILCIAGSDTEWREENWKAEFPHFHGGKREAIPPKATVLWYCQRPQAQLCFSVQESCASDHSPARRAERVSRRRWSHEPFVVPSVPTAVQVWHSQGYPPTEIPAQGESTAPHTFSPKHSSFQPKAKNNALWSSIKLSDTLESTRSKHEPSTKVMMNTRFIPKAIHQIHAAWEKKLRILGCRQRL